MDSGAQHAAQQDYIVLFQSLQQSANAKYFSGLYEKPSSTEQYSVPATSENPLKVFLTTPKLSEEHTQYLQPQR